MPLYEATLPSRYLRPLIDILDSEAPNSTQPLLEAAGLALADLDATESTFHLSQCEQLLTDASAVLRRTDLGFQIGRRITINSHGALAGILRGSRTLDELLRTVERYYRLVTPCFSARYIPGSKFGEWRIQIMAAMSQSTLRLFLELHAVSCHMDLVRLLGPKAKADIYLSMPPPAHIERYQSLRPTEFHFDQGKLPEVRLRLSNDLLLLPLPADTPTDRDILLTALEQPLHRSPQYGDWVELMLRESEAIQPTLHDLAQMLAMSTRSLSRQLASEGINLRQLGKRVRHERACLLLKTSLASLSQIAYQLGYADLTGFVRAFRELAGISPAAYRAAAQRPSDQ